MERPNTISGLMAKRAELAKYYADLVAEAKKVTCDIDHLDATIRLFDPEADLKRRQNKFYPIKHRQKQGHGRRFILDELRKAERPLSSKEITELWMADRGLKADEPTRIVLTKRVGNNLTILSRKGLIVSPGHIGGMKTWEIAQHVAVAHPSPRTALIY